MLPHASATIVALAIVASEHKSWNIAMVAMQSNWMVVVVLTRLQRDSHVCFYKNTLLDQTLARETDHPIATP